ncbi:hypothetical protein [Paraburkholderia kururiensis]|uniref:hypothetical protein n=1 Tax=Paraburkholderia kururiensis TaxID=984307 RepID=UPI0039A654DB
MSEREYSAGIGDVKRLMVQRSGRPVEPGSRRTRQQWTPFTAIAALIASVLFTWAFLHVILSYVFAADQVRH